MEHLEKKLLGLGDQAIAWLYSVRWPGLTALLAGVAVHFTVFSQQLLNADSAVISKYYFADHWDYSPLWETVQGRWGLAFTDFLRGGINLAPLAFFLMLAFYTLSGLLLCQIFQIRNRSAQFLLPVLLVCSPYVAEIATYHYCSAAYAFSYLLAIVSVLLVFYLGWPGCAAGMICLMGALSLYQANLGTVAGLCVMVLILQFLHSRDSWRNHLALIIRMVAMGVGGTLGYFLILKCILWWHQAEIVSSYSGLVGLSLFKTLPHGMALTYLDFWEYFTGHTIAQNYYQQPLAYLLILIYTLFCLFSLLRQVRQRASLGFIALLLMLLPPALCITDIINPGSSISLRTAGSLVLVVPFCLSLIFSAAALPNRSKLLKTICTTGCILLLLRGYVVQCNNDALVLQTQKNTVVSLANRICFQLEQEEDYLEGLQVCVLGLPQNGWYQEQSPLTARSSALVQYGQLSPDPVLNSRTWQMFFWSELGVEMNWCDDSTAVAIAQSSEFAQMPCYPQEGSIQTINGVIVVKVSGL